MVEAGAGAPANFPDAQYAEAGATVADAAAAWKADVVMKVQAPSPSEAKLLEDRTLLSYVYPGQNEDLLKQLQAQGATAFAMDCIPRTLSRGQSFDALSSQANIAGYRAVVEGTFVPFAAAAASTALVPPSAAVAVALLAAR